MLVIRSAPGPGWSRPSTGSMQTIKELRMAVFSLQGAARRRVGCEAACSQVVTDATAGLGFEPRLQFDGPIETMDVHIADHLLPVLREALSNIAHHAHAGHVRVTVSVAADVTLTVSDDGIGVPAEVLGGRGLINMADGPTTSAATSPSAPEPPAAPSSPGRCRPNAHPSRHDRRPRTAGATCASPRRLTSLAGRWSLPSASTPTAIYGAAAVTSCSRRCRCCSASISWSKRSSGGASTATCRSRSAESRCGPTC